MTRHFEFRKQSSSKFWEITLTGKTVSVRFGKIGADGQRQTKAFASPGAAKDEHDKLVAAKTKKGYAEVRKSASKASAEVRAEAVLAPPKARSLIDRLDRWLARERPDYHASLKMGATKAQLAKLEKAIGAPLPPTLEALFVWQGGSPKNLQWNQMLMSASDALAAQQDLTELLEAGDFDEPSWWSVGWVPFLSNGGGDHVCVDVGGSLRGPPGQVLEFWHDDSLRKVLYPSIDAWLEVLVGTLEAGVWVVDRDRAMVPNAKALEKAVKAACPGYPKTNDASKPPKTDANPAKTKVTGALPDAPGAVTANVPSPHACAVPPKAGAAAKAWRITLPVTAVSESEDFYYAVSEDGTRVAYAVDAKAKTRTKVFCDGVEGPEWPEIWDFRFAPDGRLIVQGIIGKSRHVQVGAQTFGPFDRGTEVVFAGKHFAIVGKSRKGLTVVAADGSTSEAPGADSNLPVLSASGSLAYIMMDAKKSSHVVHDGVVLESFVKKYTVHTLAIAPDGKRVACIVRDMKSYDFSLFVSGEGVKPIGRNVGHPLLGFAPKGELYYSCDDVFVLGKKRTPDQAVDAVAFDEKGQLCARVIEEEWRANDGKKLGTAQGYDDVFHPKTRRSAFCAISDWRGKLIHNVQIGKRRVGPFDEVEHLKFSAAGDVLTFVARKNRQVSFMSVSAK